MKAVRPLDGSERSFSRLMPLHSRRLVSISDFNPFSSKSSTVQKSKYWIVLALPTSSSNRFLSPLILEKVGEKKKFEKKRQRRNGTIEKVLTHCGLYLCGCYGYKSSLDTYNKMVHHHICRCTEMFPHSENDSGFVCSYHACGGGGGLLLGLPGFLRSSKDVWVYRRFQSGHRWWIDHERLSAQSSWIQRDLQQNLTFRKSFRRQILQIISFFQTSSRLTLPESFIFVPSSQ